ncbi:MAG: hypothetical protein QOI13_3451 [Paraburkholderia sp.]|nr:hypothetical protein [Paraburkholderia sp.]
MSFEYARISRDRDDQHWDLQRNELTGANAELTGLTALI